MIEFETIELTYFIQLFEHPEKQIPEFDIYLNLDYNRSASDYSALIAC